MYEMTPEERRYHQGFHDAMGLILEKLRHFGEYESGRAVREEIGTFAMWADPQLSKLDREDHEVREEKILPFRRK